MYKGPLEILSDSPVEEIETLEEAKTRQIEAKQTTSMGLFAESDNAARSCTEKNKKRWGMNDGQILEQIGTTTGDAQSTMYARLLVGRVFPESWRQQNEWATEAKFWSHFEACARTWTPETPDAPYKWMQYCVDQNLGVRGLKAAIKLAGDGDPDENAPVYVTFNALAKVTAASQNRLGLAFDEEFKSKVKPGDRVVVTIVKESD